MPLGNPEDQAAITVTDTATEITIANALSAIEFINMSSKDIYYGKKSTVTTARGGPIFSAGGRRVFENIPSNFKISFIAASGSNELRQINYL